MAHGSWLTAYGRWSDHCCHRHQPSAIGRDCRLAVRASGTPTPKPTARNLLLITIDTLRADHVGAYGYATARTPALDGLAQGRRHVRTRVCRRAGDAALARDAADRPVSSRPRLARQRPARLGGRADAGDRAPRARRQDRGVRRRVPARPSVRPESRLRRLRRPDPARPGRPHRERAARLAGRRRSDRVAAAASHRTCTRPSLAAQPTAFFLWVHLFEPHAPYGDPSTGRPALDRYDDEIATADREIGRLLDALGAGAQRHADRRRRATTAKPSASTANTRTASSSTTPRCACRWS